MDDKNNKQAWTTILESKFENHTELIEIVTFKCPVCFGLVNQPIITNCTHNICHEFLIWSTTIMGQKCPQCRTDFPANFKFDPNKKLIKWSNPYLWFGQFKTWQRKGRVNVVNLKKYRSILYKQAFELSNVVLIFCSVSGKSSWFCYLPLQLANTNACGW